MDDGRTFDASPKLIGRFTKLIAFASASKPEAMVELVDNLSF
jgi:hypothetical protein